MNSDPIILVLLLEVSSDFRTKGQIEWSLFTVNHCNIDVLLVVTFQGCSAFRSDERCASDHNVLGILAGLLNLPLVLVCSQLVDAWEVEARYRRCPGNGPRRDAKLIIEDMLAICTNYLLDLCVDLEDTSTFIFIVNIGFLQKLCRSQSKLAGVSDGQCFRKKSSIIWYHVLLRNHSNFACVS